VINYFYALLLLISGTVSLTIAGIAWQRRPAAGASALAMTMVSLVIWAWMYGVFWLVPTRSEKLFWLTLAFVGVVASSPAFLVMSAQFSGKTNWPTKQGIFTLSILPVSILTLLWTESWFGLFFGGVDFLDPDSLLQGGIGFQLSALNAFSLTFIAIFFLVRAFPNASRSKREQIALILIGSSFSFVAGMLSLFRLSPFPGLDLNPIAFTLSGVCYAYALFGFKMMDLAPMGRDSIFDGLEEGVFVLDHQDRIIDLNPKALSVVDLDVENPIGKPVKDALKTWISEIGLNDLTQSGQRRIEVQGNDFRHYDVSIIPLFDKTGEIAGRTLVWRDISKQKDTESRLRMMNAQLEYQLNEIKRLHVQLHEQAIRDSLTGLFNRGYLEETLKRELKRADREQYSLCVLMIDIDKFKQVNDRYGHQAGDKVLREFGKLLMQKIRADDIACRFGGDEFVIVMPDISIEAAIYRAQQLRQIFSDLVFRFGDTSYHTTLSIGVASSPAHGETVDSLLLAADTALYFAKSERNKIFEFVPGMRNN